MGKRVKKSVGAESRFLANMSHEIRTPMNAILGFIELVLSEKELPERQRGNLETAYNSAKYLLNLITDVLDISKLESGLVLPDEKVFDLSILVDTVISRYKPSAIDKGISLTSDIFSGCSANFLGDPGHLEKALDCLIDNAIKFTEVGGVILSVSPGCEDDTVLFEVKDSGIGISSDLIDSIFEPFTQVDGSSTRRYGGVGLGATIARDLVQLMGGDIATASSLGIGSSFIFDLPLVKVDETVTLLSKYKSKKKESGQRAFKVLLVDDVETNLELARIHLNRKGHSVILARNGMEAIDMYRSESPDLILMDIHMPVMDGHKATQFIRDLEKEGETHIPIIALTASVLQEDYDKFRSDGFDDVVDKPINFETLFIAIESVVPQGSGVKRGEIAKELEKAEIAIEHLIKEVDLPDLFIRIESKLKLYNPSEVNHLLQILEEHLPKGATKKINFAVDCFEFEDARQELQILKDEFVGK